MSGKIIIEKFGGVKETAEATGCPYTTVRYWFETDCIPSKRQKQVMEAAKELNVPVAYEDFFISSDRPPA